MLNFYNIMNKIIYQKNPAYNTVLRINYELRTDGITRRSSVKNVLLKISQHSLENSCGRASFLIKLLEDQWIPRKPHNNSITICYSIQLKRVISSKGTFGPNWGTFYPSEFGDTLFFRHMIV